MERRCGSIEVESGRAGRDGKPSVGPVYRNMLAKDGFPPEEPGMHTSWDIFRIAVQKHPKNRMLGWRELIDGKAGKYLWKTYSEVHEEVQYVGSALLQMGAIPGSRVGIYGANCPQWIITMEACNGYSLISVPLYDTLGPRAVDYVIDHAEIDFVFVQDMKIKQLLSAQCSSTGRLKSIVSFTNFTREEMDEATRLGLKLYTWEEFQDTMTTDDVYLSFLPLAHILDRVVEEYFFHNGASVGYYQGDINAIRDDLMELKPTLFAGVPRVFEKIYDGIVKALEELRPLRRKVFNILYRHKLYWMREGYSHKSASPLADFLAFRKVKNRLGGRIRLIITGGAPLSNDIEEFLRVTSCAFVTQGYGLTETCGLGTIGLPDDLSYVGTVGVPSTYAEVRLEEVPDMGYDPLGNPSRGEVCIKGRTVFSEYYKNPELTREVMKDGWFHTGDIGEINPRGVLRIIDRKKNIFKLSQGEYIASEYLEKTYSFAPIIEDMWVYGDSYKSMLVAVVVPHEGNTLKWAKSNGYIHSFSELCSLDTLKEYVLSELRAVAQKEKLRGFEYIKGVVLDNQPFDIERGLVTPTMKKRRNHMLKYYQAKIDGLYAGLQGGKM